MVFYAGGCPREPILDILLPILHNENISLITFGRTNMYDIGKIDEFVNMIISGTSTEKLKSILKLPHRLKFRPPSNSEIEEN